MEKHEEKDALFKDTKIQAGLVAILALLFLFFAQGFFLKNTLWMDEALYAGVGANIIDKGTYHLYGNEPTIAAPFLPYSIAIFYSLFGENHFVLNALMLFYALANIGILFSLGRRVLGFWNGIIPAILLIFSTLFLFYSLRILTDMPLMLFTSLTLFFFWTSFQEKKPWHLPLLAISLAAGLLMKFIFPVIALPLGIMALLQYRKELLANAKLVSASVLLFLVLAASVPIYNVASTGQATGLLSSYIGGNIGLDNQRVPFEQYFLFLPHVFSSAWIVLLIVLSSVFAFWKRDDKVILLVTVFWVTLLVLSAVMSYKEDRYILFLLPPGLLLASFAAVNGVSAAARVLSQKKEELLVDLILGAIALFALASATVLNYSNATSLVAFKTSSYGALQPAGDFIQTVTEPNEWIASNSGHELAYYAKRYTAWIDADIEKFKQKLEEKRISVIAVTVYELGNLVVPAFQKFEQDAIGTPTNSFEYLLAGVKSGEFQVIRTVNEKFGDQEATSVVIFKKVK